MYLTQNELEMIKCIGRKKNIVNSTHWTIWLSRSLGKSFTWNIIWNLNQLRINNVYHNKSVNPFSIEEFKFLGDYNSPFATETNWQKTHIRKDKNDKKHR